MFRDFLIAAASLLVALVIVGVGAAVLRSPPSAADYWHRLPACTSDDGALPPGATLCQWDAETMGNRAGRSFVSDGINVIYVR